MDTLPINESINFSTKMHASVYIGIIIDFDRNTWEITFKVPLIIDNLTRYPKAAPLFHHEYELFPNDEVVIFVTTQADPTQCYYLPITLYKFMGLKNGVNFVDITKNGIIDLQTDNFYSFSMHDSEHRTLGTNTTVSATEQLDANNVVINIPINKLTQKDIVKNREEPIVPPAETGSRRTNIKGPDYLTHIGDTEIEHTGDTTITHEGNNTITHTGNDAITHTGNSTIVQIGVNSETITGSKELTIDGNPGNYNITVTGTLNITSGGSFTFGSNSKTAPVTELGSVLYCTNKTLIGITGIILMPDWRTNGHTNCLKFLYYVNGRLVAFSIAVLNTDNNFDNTSRIPGNNDVVVTDYNDKIMQLRNNVIDDHRDYYKWSFTYGFHDLKTFTGGGTHLDPQGDNTKDPDGYILGYYYSTKSKRKYKMLHVNVLPGEITQ